jgi:hypothetical protein
MIPKPPLCEDDEEDNFDDIDCDGGLFEEEEEEIDDEIDEFTFDRSDGEAD